MNKYKLTVLLGLSSFTVAQAQQSYSLNLNGVINGQQSGMVYLQKFNNKSFVTVDSAKVVQGKYSFKSKVQLPELYGLTTDLNNNPAYVFLEQGKIEVLSDSASFVKTTKVKGSASNDLFWSYKTQKGLKIDPFIKAHPASIVSAYVLYRDFSYLLTSEEITSAIQLLSPALHHTTYVSSLKELALAKKRVEPGQKIIDFSSTDQEGNTVKLSQQLGKYLLLTFWAGWCPDCRKENPDLVKTYQKYHDQGFNIFGVSLDKSKTTWLNAIKNDNLTWKHVSDLAYWDSSAAKLYGIRWIPSNFLISPDGVIVAQNLQGEALEAKLEELLGKNSK
ncbi:redoxin domain-containing protein [Pedobacter sp. AW31-3R]|uniref:redoxin domain-containing protein n=1 Tax=Pedobacter sp. AW31-3R TaxID=3445781 RepID=UPI003FA02AEC